MNKALALLIMLLVMSVFSHFYNKHIIFKTARENLKLEEILDSKKDMNRILLMQNIELSSLARIERLAMQELDMEYPANSNSRHTILYNESKQTFSLLDFFIPSAVALSKK
jgi:cell division protein FtsL